MSKGSSNSTNNHPVSRFHRDPPLLEKVGKQFIYKLLRLGLIFD